MSRFRAASYVIRNVPNAWYDPLCSLAGGLVRPLKVNIMWGGGGDAIAIISPAFYPSIQEVLSNT